MSGRATGVGAVFTKAGAGATVWAVANDTATSTAADSVTNVGASGTIHRVLVTTTSGAGSGMIEWYHGDGATELFPNFNNLSETQEFDIECDYWNGFSFEPNFGTEIMVVFTPRS